MKYGKTICAVAAVLLLNACALTPEQKAQRAERQKRAEQALQVQLAEQCDADTAALMREQFEQRSYPSLKAKQDFQLRYVEKINDKMFQACYKMAWQNYISQQRLRDMQLRALYYDDDDLWGWHHPFLRPWGWR